MFSPSWFLLVQVQGQELWCRQVTADSHTIGRSMPLKIFNPGSFVEMDIPLSKSFSSSFHIVADVHLYCNLNSILASLRTDPNSRNFFKKPVEDVLIPISRRVFDVLHFVRPHQMGSHVSVNNPLPGSKEELLQTLDKLNSEIQFSINKAGISGQGGAESAEKSSQFGSYSASFFVSQDAVSFMKNAVQNSSAQNATAETVQPLTPQATVLHFILMDSSITRQQIDSKYSGIDLLTVNGSQASIQVKPATGTSADGLSLEVSLYCPCIPLICRLHEAVLARFQPVIKRETRKSQMRAYDLQKAIEKLQTLQVKIMSLEDAASSSRSFLSHDNSNGVDLKLQLWTLYEELGRIVLVI